MEEEELQTRLAEEEEMGLNYKKMCEQGNTDIVQLDLEVEQLQVEYFLIRGSWEYLLGENRLLLKSWNNLRIWTNYVLWSVEIQIVFMADFVNVYSAADHDFLLAVSPAHVSHVSHSAVFQ